MVDRIYDLQKGKSARGIKNISCDDGFMEEILPGVPVFSPVIAAEAAAQLVSWIIIEARNFTVKPVITMVDRYVCSGKIMPGDRLELSGEIESFSPDSVLAHGKVSVNGRVIVELDHAVCFLYPLNDLEPPERARIQFKNLHDETYTLPDDPTVGCSPVAALQQRSSGSKRGILDVVLPSKDKDVLKAIKNITSTMDFFNDHFPLKPVLPGVVMIESMVSLARQLLDRQMPAGRTPVLKQVNKIKFRKFVIPGDQLLIEAKLKSFSDLRSSLSVKVTTGGRAAATAVLDFEHLHESGLREKFC